MCRKVKTLSICPTCNGRIAENTSTQWCRDARRRGAFGRCTMGIRRGEEEFRGEDCQGCNDQRERLMNEMEMSDFAVKSLGWRPRGRRGRDDDDDDDCTTSYTW